MTPDQMQHDLSVDGAHFTTAGQAIEAECEDLLLVNALTK